MSEHQDPAKPEGASPSGSPRLPHWEAEYEALREEILRRIELQYQLLNLALIIAGTLLTISLSQGALTDEAGSNSQRLLLLVCPPLEMFLALAWAAHNVQIAKAGIYIKCTFEAGGAARGWESYWPQHRGLSGRRRLAVRWLFTGGLPAAGVFAGTQLLTLLLSYPPAGADWPWRAWYILDLLMPAITVWCILESDIRRLIEKAGVEDEPRAESEAGREAE